MADLSSQIKKQVEFYFSDSNYPRDKFMKEQASKDDGYIPLSILLKFNKLKQLTTDEKLIVEALEGSELVEVDEAKTKVKRTLPLPEEDPTIDRTILVSSLPTDATMEQIEELFGKQGKILSIRMIKDRKDKTFNGTAFVEFESADVATKALTTEVSFGETALSLKSKKDWYTETRENREKSKKRKEPEKEEEKEEKTFTKGKIIKFSNIGTEDVNRTSLASVFSTDECVCSFVEYEEGSDSGYARMESPAHATKIVGILTEKKQEVGGKEGTFVIIEGDEEQQYWNKVFELQKQKRSKGRGGRGGGRGGRGRGGRRGGGGKRQRN